MTSAATSDLTLCKPQEAVCYTWGEEEQEWAEQCLKSVLLHHEIRAGFPSYCLKTKLIKFIY